MTANNRPRRKKRINREAQAAAHRAAMHAYYLESTTPESRAAVLALLTAYEAIEGFSTLPIEKSGPTVRRNHMLGAGVMQLRSLRTIRGQIAELLDTIPSHAISSAREMRELLS